MLIRKEEKSDFADITKVTIAAFKNHPVSGQTEQFIIDALRRAGVLTLSLVAEIDGEIVGHIAFSPVAISDGSEDWFGLGPVSVVPKLQKQGIGKALINKGLSLMKEIGQGCVLVGFPDYYKKFGFVNYPQLIIEEIPQEYFLALPFNEKIPKGIVTFDEAFKAES